MIDHELAASLEQVEQTCLPVRTFEDVVFLDLHHRLPAALRGQGILGARNRFLLREQSFMSGLPLLLRNDSGKHLRPSAHPGTPCRDGDSPNVSQRANEPTRSCGPRMPLAASYRFVRPCFSIRDRSWASF